MVVFVTYCKEQCTALTPSLLSVGRIVLPPIFIALYTYPVLAIPYLND